MSEASDATPDPVDRLRKFYSDFSHESLAGIDSVYDPGVEFVDPVHTIHNREALNHYLGGMLDNLISYEMHYLDILSGPHSAYLTWEMIYAHSGVRSGKPIKLRGISHVRFNERVHYHEDSYDLGALIYDHLPLLGGLTNLVKKRLAAPGRSS